MALVEVKVPDIGDFEDVEVIEVLVKPGDTIKAEQSSDHGGERQGLDGDSVVACRRREGTEGQARRQGQPRARWCCCWRPAVRGRAVAHSRLPRLPPLRAASRRSGACRCSGCAGRGQVDVEVPDIGDFDAVAVIEVLVKPGDSVKAEQSLITVESDKASMEIPSSHAGVVKELKVKIGDKVSQGLAGGGARRRPRGAAARAARRGTGAAAAAAPAALAAPAPAGDACRPPRCRRTSRTRRTAPCRMRRRRCRRFARELGVPLDEVKGSGPKGRITQEDVQGFVKGVMAGDRAPRPQAAKATGAGRGGRRRVPGPAAVAAGRLHEVRRRSSARTCRASRRSAAPTCTATG